LREHGAHLPECAFADDLEQLEVKEGDFAVKIDRLRATANSPHGVVEGEEEDGPGQQPWSRKDH
jgi:hypothetical protein